MFNYERKVTKAFSSYITRHLFFINLNQPFHATVVPQQQQNTYCTVHYYVLSYEISASYIAKLHGNPILQSL